MSFAVENFIYIEGDFYVKTIKINPAYTESRASFKIIVQQNLFESDISFSTKNQAPRKYLMRSLSKRFSETLSFSCLKTFF